MKILILTKDELFNKVAKSILDLVKRNPSSVLALSTGSTMIPLYRKITSLSKTNKIDFSNVTTFNLDEYSGLRSDDKNSYHYFMERHLFNKINIDKRNTFFPSSDNNYETLIKKKGGIDLAIVGIGRNGHIAFNEPGSDENCLTRKIKLTEETRKSNKRFFSSLNKVPTHSFTMGIKTILSSKKIFLIAIGKYKSKIIYKLIKEDNNNIPANYLKKHKDFTLFCDNKSTNRL
jgi:glucosamine-6-phosphate deaminase